MSVSKTVTLASVASCLMLASLFAPAQAANQDLTPQYGKQSQPLQSGPLIFNFSSGNDKPRELTQQEKDMEGFKLMQKAIKAGDFKTAFPMVKTMAERGYPYYELLLSDFYQYGKGVEKNQREATVWLMNAANHGDKSAQLKVGTLLFNGDSIVKRNYEDARKVLEPLRTVYPEAAFLVGQMYMDGLGGKKDYQRAVQAFSTADKEAAKVSIGMIYSHGGYGAKRHYGEAKKWLEGSTDPLALGTLAMICVQGGYGAEKNKLKANECFKESKTGLEKLAQNKNTTAQFLLGLMHYSGSGVEKNDTQARKYFEASYDPASQYYLGLMHENGEGGFTKDAESAQAFYKAATDAGFEIPKEEASESAQEKIAQGASENSDAKTGDSPKTERSEQVSPTGEKRDLSTVFEDTQALLKECFPKATISKTDTSLHFEFKAQKIAGRGSNLITAPKLDGIVGDITLKPGKYQGKEYLPLTTHEALYSSLLMAPYSASAQSHLLTKLLFPPNASSDFIERFKEVVSSYQ